MNAVELDRLAFAYGRGPAARQALRDVSFHVPAGETFALLGPNGGGKTTLFKILSTQIRPASGRAFIYGADIDADPAAGRRRLGVVFQNPSLDKKLTLEENLRHQGRLYGLHGARLNRRIDETLERFALADRRKDPVERLSGGLQRRGEIAKSLLHEPDLLLMDEPSTGLDPAARRSLWGYLADLRAAKVTILLTTHLMDEAARCDRVGILDEGRLRALGEPERLIRQIGGDVIAVETADASSLAVFVRDRFRQEAAVVDGTVRIERPDGHLFVPQLVESFPGRITAITVGKPTLEDVFVHETGRPFDEATEGAA